MQADSTEFGKLPEADQLAKLKGMTDLLAEHGLGHIKPKLFEQIVCPLKAPDVMRETSLVVEGSVK